MRSVRVMLIALGMLALIVLLPTLVAAWDSWPPDTSSHWYFVRDAVNDLLSRDSKGDEEERKGAYLNLGRLIHLIEDQSVPAHANYIMHGGNNPANWDNFEILAAQKYDPDYYKKPDSPLQPGKNILDAGRHGDDDYLTCTLRWSPSCVLVVGTV